VKLATFTENNFTRLGVIQGDAARDLGAIPGTPTDMIELLAGGPEAMQKLRAVASEAPLVSLSKIRLEPPILRPRKFLGLGASYRDHAKEMNRSAEAGRTQIWFNKQVTSVNGPYDDVYFPRGTGTMDYEGELAIVIGARGRRVRGAEAIAMIAGFTVSNDFSIREWQRRSPTHTLGKSFDTHGPIGPWIVTADELPAADKLELKTWVNGELRQSANTSELQWSFLEMIEELAAAFTLEPGDILSTGTPAGVGAGRAPPLFLKIGDVVRVEIERIGVIQNRVVAEP
jgi:2-keto-4-pentenoate hydratase/2-oxohepta-3-ene-1,7-dioic acid hydratase in catechol pathway